MANSKKSDDFEFYEALASEVVGLKYIQGLLHQIVWEDAGTEISHASFLLNPGDDDFQKKLGEIALTYKGVNPNAEQDYMHEIYDGLYAIKLLWRRVNQLENIVTESANAYAEDTLTKRGLRKYYDYFDKVWDRIDLK